MSKANKITQDELNRLLQETAITIALAINVALGDNHKDPAKVAIVYDKIVEKITSGKFMWKGMSGTKPSDQIPLPTRKQAMRFARGVIEASYHFIQEES